MAKTHTTVTVDVDVLESARALRINISGEFNDFLKALLNQYNEDVDGINVRLERINLEKAIKKNQYWQSTIKECQAKIEKWEQRHKEKEEERLKKEKEEIENSKKCLNCGRVIEGEMKSHEFIKGIVCNVCFLNSNADDLKRWNSK